MIRNKKALAAVSLAAVMLMSASPFAAFAEDTDSRTDSSISTGDDSAGLDKFDDETPDAELSSSPLTELGYVISDELSVPEMISALYSNSELSVAWKPQSDADGCILYKYNSETKHYKYSFSAESPVIIDEYDPAEKTEYYIVSYKKSGDKTYISKEKNITSLIKKKPDTQIAPEGTAVTKVSRTSNALRIYWTPVKCSGYEVYMIVDGKWKLMQVVEGSLDNLRIAGLDAATEYSFTVRPFIFDVSKNTVYGPYSAAYTASTKASASAPAKVSFTKASKTAAALRVYWGKTECDGYELYMYKNGSWQMIAQPDSAADNYKLTKLQPSTQYSFKIRAYKLENGKRVYSEFSSIFNTMTKADAVAPAKPVISSTSRSSGAVRINWDKQTVSGCEIYKVKNDAYVLVCAVAGDVATYKFTGLKPSTEYSYAIRTFNTNSKGEMLYSDYSETVTVKTKSDAVKPDPVKFVKTSKAKLALRPYWTKVKCDGYELYMKKDGKYVLIKELSADTDNFRVAGLESGVSYYFKIRAFNTDSAGARVYSDMSSAYKVTTKSDLVKKNGITYINGVMIVNKSYPVPSSYNPGGLTAETSAAFSKMQAAARSDGYNLWITSGFRSYATQQYLYNSYVARDGQAAADRYSARPGYSEHQTGLALDINYAGSSFDSTPEARWIADNCYKYGFIIRYPKGKEDITGYKYESWHVRYVGKTLATELTKKGLTLEEYFNITSKY